MMNSRQVIPIETNFGNGLATEMEHCDPAASDGNGEMLPTVFV